MRVLSRLRRGTGPIAALVLAAVGLIAPAAAQQPTPVGRTPDGKLDLAVLVTGRPDGERRAQFADFLRTHFARVGVTDYSSFTPAAAEGYDVVVFDCELRPRPGVIGLASPPQLPADFARASVLVAGGGAILARPLGLKTDWG